MNEPSPKRRLAALMMADIVGYSRLVGIDEYGTIERVRRLRTELLEPAISRKSGRLIKDMGDGFLAEFASVVDATVSAIEIQEKNAQRNGGQSGEEPLQLRIGVHVGDVLIQGDDLLGDGVNVVARLEAAASPGTVCLSLDAFRHIEGKLPFAFDDIGEHSLKNIARPMRLYRWASTAAKLLPIAPPALPDRPSIAVLPFPNMSGEPEQEYFVDGMVEDILSALSHVRWLFVIARQSSFSYKGRAVDVKHTGRELGVRYVVEGSVRKSGNRVRITAQLIDAETERAHLGRPLGARPERHLRPAGRDHRADRQRYRAHCSGS